MAKDHTSPVPAPLRRGRYVARFVADPADLIRAQVLRHKSFVEDAGRPACHDGRESDRFDALCDHVIVEDPGGRIVCCFRLLTLQSGADIHTSYSAQYYNLERLSGFKEPLVELGRFCVDPAVSDPDVLRIAWGSLAAYVDARGVRMLFGCSSFAGVDAAVYAGAFDILTERHLAPADLRPLPKAREVVAYAQRAGPVQDRRAALGQVPALLKTYLSMGGWVSDHAVVDREMNTLHVFTALEIAAIPEARARALRAVAG